MSNKIIPHMCLICNRNTDGCDRIAFYSAEGEVAGSAMLEYSAQVLTHDTSGQPTAKDARLKGCRVYIEYADDGEDHEPTSFDELVRQTVADVNQVLAAIEQNRDRLARGNIDAFERFWTNNADDESEMLIMHNWLLERYKPRAEAALPTRST